MRSEGAESRRQKAGQEQKAGAEGSRQEAESRRQKSGEKEGGVTFSNFWK